MAGTAVAVGGGFAPAGIGTCTGGSLRIPASVCGIVGFRPTVGRWPGGGIVPISHTRDTPGPMTTTVGDAMLIDRAVTGNSAAYARVPLRGLRLGVPRAQFWDVIASDVEPLLDGALERLRAAGAVLVECQVADVTALTNVASAPINFYEIVRDLDDYLTASGLAIRFADVVREVASPDVAAILRPLATAGGGVTATAYRQAMERDRPALQSAYARCFADYDVAALVFPTTPLTAAKIGEDETTLLDGTPVSTFLTYVKNTHPGSVAGLPGLSIPAGTNARGLPIGLALDGPIGSDITLLGIAAAVEACLADGSV